MAWLQVHQTLKDHRKLFDAADQLEVEPPHMMGLLVSFWLWALDNAPTGSLVDITPRMISRAAQWDGDPEKLAKTLIRAGWIDEKRGRDARDPRLVRVRRQADRPAASRERALPQSQGRCCGVCRRLAGRPNADRRTTGKQPQESRRQSRPE